MYTYIFAYMYVYIYINMYIKRETEGGGILHGDA